MAGWRTIPRIELNEKFWSLVQKNAPEEPDGCWIWKGRVNHARDGYGQFSPEHGLHYRAHRLAYELIYGAVPKGQPIMHRCDNPPCVRPDHLILGTTIENVADKVSKGRQSRGSNHGISKLTEDDVREIRRSYLGDRRCGPNHRSSTSQRAIAERFGVTQMVVQMILSGKTWTHVT